jgi:hypothetical protein
MNPDLFFSRKFIAFLTMISDLFSSRIAFLSYKGLFSFKAADDDDDDDDNDDDEVPMAADDDDEVPLAVDNDNDFPARNLRRSLCLSRSCLIWSGPLASLRFLLSWADLFLCILVKSITISSL